MRTLTLVMLVSAVVWTTTAQAVDRFWIGTTDGDWFDQSKWSTTMPPQLGSSPASVPGIGDEARFEFGGTSYLVTFSNDVDVTRVTIPNDVVTFDLAGRQLTLPGVLHVGTVGDDIGSLTLTDGAVVSPLAFVGFTGGDGRFIVQNNATLIIEGSQNPLDATFSIGGAPGLFGGLGQLQVFGTVDARDTDSYVGGSLHGTGTATVDGGTWSTDGSLIIGDDGAEGHLFITNGGVVSAGLQTYVGKSGRTNEFVDVTGTGELEITDGTLTTGATATIGSAENAFGEADIAGPNAVWNINGFLFVGESGIGNMHVRDEANVHVQNNSFISVGTNEALLNITTAGSFLNDGSMYVGGGSSSAGGPGHLLVQSNGSLTVGDCLKVWETGTLTLEGASIVTDCFEARPGATLNFNSGTLTVNGGPFSIPVDFSFGGSNPFDPPEIILLNGAVGTMTDFTLGGAVGTSSAFNLDNATIHATDDINIGGDDAGPLGQGVLSVTAGNANAGDLIRIWETGVFNVDSGQVTATDLSITGGLMTVGGVDTAVYIDDTGEFPQGLPGIHVGFAGAFTGITLERGGRLVAPEVDLSIASDTATFAIANVTGPGSKISARDARIGSGGDGSLSVTDEASASFHGELVIASAPNSLGTLYVENAGSYATCAGRMTVGRQGLGTLHLTAGASFLSESDTRIGALAAAVNPAPGYVIVDGADWVSNGSIYVGGDELGAQGGGGQIFLKTDGLIDNKKTAQVWATGTLSLEGGTLRTRDLLFEAGASFQMEAGSVIVEGGEFRTPSTSLVFGGADPSNPVNFEFLAGADAQTTFAWHIGRNADTFGVTKVSGVANGTRSTLRGTGGGGGADLVVGLFGNGVLHVEDGGLVDFGDDVIIGNSDSANGVVNVGGVSGGQRATLLATRAGSGAAISVGGKHDGSGITGGTGELTIENGGLAQTSGDMYIGRRSGSVGTVRLIGEEAGHTAELAVGDDLFIGGDAGDGFGDGSLDIQDGGLVNVTDTVQLWAEGSFDLTGGTLITKNLIREAPAPYSLKRGTIRIDGGSLVMGGNTHSYGGPDETRPPIYEFVNGALFEIPTSFTIGAVAGTFAKTVVDGLNGTTPSTIRNVNDGSGADIIVGEFGNGVLEVTNGGLIDAMDDFVVGAATGSTGLAVIDGVNQGIRSTVVANRRGVNSAIAVGARLAGEAGNGELRVTNGALASCSGEIDLAHQVGSQALVTVKGAAGGFDATLHTDGNFFVGGTETEFGGRAQLRIGRDGLVDVGQTMRVWPDAVVDVTDGELRVNQLDLMNAEPGSFNLNSGRLEANGILGDFENFGGTFAHGAITGGMSLDGHYTQYSGATLEIDMLDLNLAAVGDVVAISGTATLGGTLRVNLTDGLTPAVGERLTIMTYASRIGEFDRVVINGTAVFDIVYNANSIEIVVADSTAVLGDFNGDGLVGAADYGFFHGCMTGPDDTDGPAADCIDADLTGDGSVDLRDAGLFQSLFGFAGRSDVKRWTSPVDGAWITPDNWRAAELPVPGDYVIVDVPDAEVTVLHDNSVPFDGPFATLISNEKLRLEFSTLSVTDSFQMNNTLEMACGLLADTTVDLGPNGVISVVRHVCTSAVEGVTINGNLDLVTDGAPLISRNAPLTINGNVRIGGFTGSAATGLYFFGANKVLNGNATISFTRNPSSSAVIQSDHGTLHLTSGVTIRGAEGRVGRVDQPLILDGIIDSDTSGLITVSGTETVNNGTMRTSGAGSELSILGSWTNHGQIEASGADMLILCDDDGSFENLGTIFAEDTDVRLGGTFTVADLGDFDFINSPAIIEGTLVNDTGLTVDAGKFNWRLGRGTILGGTIASADGTPFDAVPGNCCGNATLDGVTLDANMHVQPDAIVFVNNGLMLNGTISLHTSNPRYAILRVTGPNRFIEGTGRIVFATSGANALTQSGLGQAGDDGLLAIGPDITIYGAAGTIGVDGGQHAASVVSEGTIHSDRPGIIRIEGDEFFNLGTVRSSGGGQLWVRAPWVNEGITRIEAGPVTDVDSDFTQSPPGTFVTVVSTTANGGFGKMVVDGTAILGGTLRLEFDEGFTPAAGQSFTVMEYGNRLGTFDFVEAPGLDPGSTLVPSYEAGFLSIAISSN